MITPANLPPRAQELADIIGLDALLRLVDRFGGLKIRVHATPQPDSPLAQCLGLEAYAALQAYCPAEYIEPPLLHTGREALLIADVLASRARGEAVARIARRHRIPERRVYRIMARARDAGEQEELDLQR